ncbi:MAG: dimethyl sulfoxide reductase anchor subunit family protein [Inquilinaceae bacterium]
MHPAFSLIFFTTVSGAGYGVLFWLGLLGGVGAVPEGRGFALAAFGLALGAVGAGLLSSVLHLGHPERAWRAFSQWRSSWLSREGVAALVTFAPAGAWALTWLWTGEGTGAAAVALGLATAALAAVTVGCTAMIYASLKPIHQWHNRWVLPSYLALGGMSGALWLNALLALWGRSPAGIEIGILVVVAVAALIKEGLWRFIATTAGPATPASATGLGAYAAVRMLDAPHTEANYLLREMGYVVGRRHARALRLVARVAGFAVPAVCLAVALVLPDRLAALAAVPAAIAVSLGLVAERWLFFAEARHTVTLYYGAQAA